MNGKLFWISLVLIAAFPKISFSDVLYYKELSPSDAAEIDVIRENYNRFSPELKAIALSRIEEIKLKLMSKDFVVNEYVKRASAPVVGGSYPIGVLSAIKFVQQSYLALPLSVRYELTEYAIGKKEFSLLSQQAKDWYSNKIVVNAHGSK